MLKFDDDKQCFFQIIYAKDNEKRRWVTTIDNIDFKHKKFKTITILKEQSNLSSKELVKRLFDKNKYFPSNILSTDGIRNPTIKELNQISSMLKSAGYIYNLKKKKLFFANGKEVIEKNSEED